MHPFIQSFTKEKRMYLNRSQASDKINQLKAVYRQVEAEKKKNG